MAFTSLNMSINISKTIIMREVMSRTRFKLQITRRDIIFYHITIEKASDHGVYYITN